MYKSKWRKFIDFISSFDVGDIVKQESFYLINADAVEENSKTEQYKRKLIEEGYLSERSPYKVLRKVPKNLKRK